VANPTQTTTFRFDPATLDLIDGLARARSVSKTDLLRSAVELLHDSLVVAAADANAMLEVIRERHPDADNVVVDVSPGRDGRPQATALVDGKEVPDIGAHAAVVNRKAYVFLTIVDGAASIAVPIGDDALLVRPQFSIADPMPWPRTEGYQIVLSLKMPAKQKAVPASPAKVRTRS